MYELHITPKPEFIHDFVDIAQRFKFKLIGHWNYDIDFNALYHETMIAEKCKDLSELNQKLDLMFRTARHHNLLRVKVESKINDDFTFEYPYKMGTQYFEVHIDVEITNSYDKEKISRMCRYWNMAISKSSEKSNYMLTYRCKKISSIFQKRVLGIINMLKDQDFKVTRVLKEYAFLDDNISVDDPWLDTYKDLKETNENN